MKNVYVVLDNDMEDSVVTAEIYSTYEKAEKAVKETIQELEDQYEKIEEYDHGWLFIDGDNTDRVIEIEASGVK
ncbi:hypothetical protein FOL85_09860 [Lactobacillus reuteri]|uniref:hypothetical protein n=1 Tax=Limosilactobacillus reuteri TaxID=1598 RepID=UPI001469C312|nr:hypothetical protein [Limosilactobacillus reuteri]NMV51752.1 hypothetical protein [Limosilactobacillus reuteri]NMV56889.1 hypothetical protein [Limosilactobacillus reuteri]NMV65371.1 hypothetical protein [Limosilactobacillus reuteri]